MKMWDTAWIKVLSDVTVAHGDEYKATAAAAEHFSTKVVLLKGILVEVMNVLNYKNVMNEVLGYHWVLVISLFVSEIMLFLSCEELTWALLSNLKCMVCPAHVELAFLFRELQFSPCFSWRLKQWCFEQVSKHHWTSQNTVFALG